MKVATSAAFAATILLTLSRAQAHEVMDVAMPGAMGCYSKQDFVDINQARKSANGDIDVAQKRLEVVISRKISEKKCFAVTVGDVAITDPSWNPAGDAWSGIVVMSTRSGIRFYSTPWTWRYVGDVRKFAEP